MTDTTLSATLFVLLAGATGCQSGLVDFLETDGTYASGQAFHLKADFKRHYCDREQQPGCISLQARVVNPDPSLAVVGLRLEYLPDQMVGQTSFTSGLLPLQPVALEVVRPGSTATGELVETYTLIEGGQIDFTSIGTGPRQVTAGTFRDMTLLHVVAGAAPQAVLTLPSGKFQYYFPDPTDVTGGSVAPDGGQADGAAQ